MARPMYISVTVGIVHTGRSQSQESGIINTQFPWHACLSAGILIILRLSLFGCIVLVTRCQTAFSQLLRKWSDKECREGYTQLLGLAVRGDSLSRRDYGYMVCNDPCRLDEDPYCTSTRTVYDHRIRGAVKGAGLFFECKII